jgi:8-oxo-dGTP pyrophosphatase MutT (NUDIX family)
MSDFDFAAGVVVFRESPGQPREFLIVKNASGHWELPKGHLRRGETWMQGALREAREETGLAELVLIDGFARQIQYVFRDRKKGIVCKKVNFALARADFSPVVLSDEHTEFAYLNLEAARARLSHVGTRQLLVEAEAFMENHM